VLLLVALMPMGANAACPERSFIEFLMHFSTDARFSQDRTHWPLKLITEQFGDPKSAAVSYLKDRTQYWGLEKPIFDFLRANPNMRVYPQKQSNRLVVLTFGIEDADVVFDLIFEKTGGDCWMLTGVRDFER
jgi:hypothetical protein